MSALALLGEGLSTKKYVCPISGCNTVVVRLDRHLKSVHGLKSKSKQYLNALNSSKIIEDNGQLISNANEKVSEAKSCVSLLTFNDKEPKSFTPILPFELLKHAPSTLQEEKVTTARPLQLTTNKILKPCQVDVQSTREQFRSWMCTLAGGTREKHAANQHIAQAFTLIDNSSQLFLSCAKSFLPCEHVVISSKIFLQAVEKTRIGKDGRKRAPGTICSYLTSFALYVSFLQQEYGDVLPAEALVETSRAIKILLKRLQKLKARRRIDVKTAEKQQLITKDDIKHFLHSDSRHQILAWLHDPEAIINLQRAAQIRNLLMSEILIQCPQRSGALASMTLQDFRSATPLTNTSGKVTFVISVPNHKTAQCYGPANFPLTEPLYQNICAYVERIRPRTQDLDDNHLFVTRNCKPLSAADVSNGINSAWQMSECRQTRVTATLARKSVGQACLETRPSLIEPVAALMTHSIHTHRQYYQHFPSFTQTAAVGQSIRKLMGVDEGPMWAFPETDESDGAFVAKTFPEGINSVAGDKCSGTGVLASKDFLPSHTELLKTTSVTGESDEDFLDKDVCLSLANQLPDTLNQLSHGRHKLSTQQRHILRLAFAKCNGKVSTAEIRKVASSIEDIANIVKEHGLITVYNSIRSQRKYTY